MAMVVAAACRGAQPSPEPAAADLVKPLPSPLPDVAARVNGQAILTRNVAIAARQALKAPGVSDDKKPPLIRQTLFQLIARELLFQEAIARGLTPNQKALEQAYNEARVPYRDDRDWSDFLAQQGLDPEAFQAELRARYTIQALLEQEAVKVPEVGEAEARSFYEQNPTLFDSGPRLRARHILLRVPQEIGPPRKAEIRTKAEGILVRLRKGADFAKLATEFSDDEGTRRNGGLLDVFSRGQMANGFEDAAYALKPGATSDVVETEYGFHIIKLEEQLPAEKRAFEEVRGRIQQRLAQQKHEQAVQALVNALKAKARIETFL
jgi:peptidyl-prolyl cis-trans isomerase C